MSQNTGTVKGSGTNERVLRRLQENDRDNDRRIKALESQVNELKKQIERLTSG